MTRSFFLFATFCSMIASGQYAYDIGPEQPFGLPNPEAPEQLLDWAPLIGSCQCISERRNPDGSWGQPEEMLWRWKYIMNGMAVQDETLKADGVHSGSIRQFNRDSTQWYVHYYSSGSAAPVLPAWKGGRQDSGDIVLYREQQAPNGMDGFYKIVFSDISENGFNWLGQWVNPDETITYPTWRIRCERRSSPDSGAVLKAIKDAADSFSAAYMNADYTAMMQVYHPDAKILPPGAAIIEGSEAIRQRWVLPEGVRITHHQSTPEHIRILGDTAYDYGYYNGSTRRADGSEVEWRGKYLIVWKAHEGRWKMLLDIWNRVND